MSHILFIVGAEARGIVTSTPVIGKADPRLDRDIPVLINGNRFELSSVFGG
jgi:hypothetical protein